SLVLQRLHKAQLLIAGEGPECARLQRYSEQLGIASSVCWLGYREALAELYPRLSVLLIPSRSEGLPNVALEAMAYGIPVVAAAVGGLPEIISDGETGFLAPSGEAHELAQKIIALIENPSLRRTLGVRGREVVALRFSLEARIRTLTDIYDSAMARN